MAAFSDLITLLTNLSNKIRSKLGTSTTYTPAQAISAIDDVYTKGVTDTKVGTAGVGDVLSGKTFTNSSSVGASGSMTNNGAVSQSLNCGGSYTVPAGYHNGSGKVTANSLASQTGVDSGKTAVTAGTMLTGYQGWVNGSKITGTMANQGKKTQTLNTSTTSYTIPAGYHDGTGSVSISTQTKSTTSSRTAQTITPDSGKVLSSVSIAKYPDASGTFTPNSSQYNSSAADMGATNNLRYVNTSVCYNAGIDYMKVNSFWSTAKTSPDTPAEAWIAIPKAFVQKCSQFYVTSDKGGGSAFQYSLDGGNTWTTVTGNTWTNIPSSISSEVIVFRLMGGATNTSGFINIGVYFH